MRIVSWNVNGLRAVHRKQDFVRWLKRISADVVGVQEVRAHVEQLPEELRAPRGWSASFASAVRAGYSGVGLYSKQAPNRLVTKLGVAEVDREGRVQIATFGKLTVVNAYFPNGNGKERDLSRIPFKLDFYRRLFRKLERPMRRGERLLVMGDFNTAHTELDLARPKQNKETSGFRPEEREELDRWIRAGWVDTFRVFQKEGGHYSWWSQRVGVRKKNIGWRIDYVLASPGVMPFVKGAAIHKEMLGSDHCPVSVELDPEVVR